MARKMQELISNLRVKLRCSNFKLQLPIHFPPTSKVSPDFPELPRSVQPQDAYLRSCASMSCQRWPSVHGVGGRRCPPLGVFNPPATAGGHRVLNSKQQPQPSNTRHQVEELSASESDNLVFPLSIISPQAPGDHRSPAIKMRFLRLVGLFGSIFCSSETRFKKCL